jgi:hypothetical protein
MASFLDGHTEWLEQVNSRQVQVKVVDPQTTGMFKKTTTYAVVSYIQAGVDEVEVRRRYSDFDWLYDVLRTRYTGIPVPNIPPKSIPGLAGEAFIANRMAGLDLFLKDCLKNPFLKDDDTFKAFLKSEEVGGGWDSFKKDASARAKLPWAERTEADRWRLFLESHSNQGDISAVVEVTTAFVDLFKSAIDTTLKKCNGFGTKTKSLAGSLDEVHNTWAQYHDTAYSAADQALANATFEGFKLLANLLDTSLEGTGVLADIEMGRVTRMTTFFEETLGLLRHKIVSLRKVLTKYSDLQKQSKNAKSAHNRAIADLESLAAKGKDDKDDKLKNAVEAKEKISMGLEKELKSMEISVACVQIPTVLDEMKSEFQDKVVYFAKAEAAKEQEQVEFWSGQMEKLGFKDGDTTLIDTKKQLELISPLDIWLADLSLGGSFGAGGSSVATSLPESV